ncbi:MAG: MFS transporter [Acidimicrobiia bacterium]
MNLRRRPEPSVESATDALLDGDQVLAPGTAVAALRRRDFRLFWGGTFASNIGTWMQNVLLGAYGYELTHSSSYVGLLVFAQLGPLILLAPLGGVLADHVDRRRLLVLTQLEQLAGSVVLALLASSDHPSHVAIFICVLAIGAGNALSAPALSAILPTLVPRQDLAGAVSLQSAQMNLSRVVGPVLGAPLYVRFGASPVFLLNALTYLFAVAAVVVVAYPRRAPHVAEESGWAHLLSGFRIAWRDRLIRHVLSTMMLLSLFSLTFVGLMPVIAAQSLGIRPKSASYGWLYAIFGLGAAAGATAVGTLLVDRSKAALSRLGLVALAGILAIFGLLRSAAPAYPVALLLGLAYFTVVTSLATLLQEHLDDALRGRVLALWIVAFGGSVPVGVLAAGYAVRATSITAVVLVGAAVAAVLALRPVPAGSGPVVGEVEDGTALGADEGG